MEVKGMTGTCKEVDGRIGRGWDTKTTVTGIDIRHIGNVIMKGQIYNGLLRGRGPIGSHSTSRKMMSRSGRGCVRAIKE